LVVFAYIKNVPFLSISDDFQYKIHDKLKTTSIAAGLRKHPLKGVLLSPFYQDTIPELLIPLRLIKYALHRIPSLQQM